MPVLWRAGENRLSKDQAHGCRYSLIMEAKTRGGSLATRAYSFVLQPGWNGPFQRLNAGCSGQPMRVGWHQLLALQPLFLLIGRSAWWMLTSGRWSRLPPTPHPWHSKRASQSEQQYKGFSTERQCWSLGRSVYAPLEEWSDYFSVNSNTKLT